MARDIENPMLWHQAIVIFENQMMPRLRAIEATQSGNPDWPLRCETWHNWVDWQGRRTPRIHPSGF